MYRTRRIHGNQSLAADAERRGVGSADSVVLSASHAHRAAALRKRGVVGSAAGCGVPERPPSDSDLHLSHDGRSMDLLSADRSYVSNPKIKVIVNIFIVSRSAERLSDSACG